MTDYRLNRLHAHRLQSEIPPTIVAFLSGKGGVGKSILSFNTAAAMARKGLRCLLIDLDWYFGNIHLLANIGPNKTIRHILDSERPEKAITALEPNLDLIASAAVENPAPEFNPEYFSRLAGSIGSLFHGYEYIILDTASGMPELITPVALAADFPIVVLNPELTSIADSYGLFKHLRHSGCRRDISIFVNQADSGMDCEYIYQKFTAISREFLDTVPLLAGYLLDDKYVIDSVARQRAIVDLYPNSSTHAQFLKLLKYLTKGGPRESRKLKTTKKTSINSKTTLADIKE